jgi:hypothetical protein
VSHPGRGMEIDDALWESSVGLSWPTTREEGGNGGWSIARANSTELQRQSSVLRKTNDPRTVRRRIINGLSCFRLMFEGDARKLNFER